jgi:hypothetical protein
MSKPSGGGAKSQLVSSQAEALNALKQGYNASNAALEPYTSLKSYNPLYEYLSTGVETPESKALMQGNDINSWIQQNPAYQYQLQESEQGINRAASARGMWDSAAATNALADNSRALSASNWTDYYGRLGNIYNTAFGANTNLAQNEMNYGSGKAGIYQTMGQAIAQAKAAEAASKKQDQMAMWSLGGTAILNAYSGVGNSGPSYQASGGAPASSGINYGGYSPYTGQTLGQMGGYGAGAGGWNAGYSALGGAGSGASTYSLLGGSGAGTSSAFSLLGA